jgi:hypothetical protein
VKDASPQSVGSAITYLRRYALQSFAGVAPEDDDAEAAHGRAKGQVHQTETPPPSPPDYLYWLDDLALVADEGTVRLEKAWKASRADYRQHLTSTDSRRWEGLKKHALSVDIKTATKVMP